MKMIIVAIIAVAIACILFTMLRNKRHDASDASEDEWPPEMLAEIEAARAVRAQVQQSDPDFFDAVSAAMFRHDPIGINMGDNSDEYEAEAGTVIPRLPDCASEDDVGTVLHEEFTKWFGAATAGKARRYEALAEEIWMLWNEREAEQEDGEGR